MDNVVVEILIPKETVSDDSYKITTLLFNNGDAIKKGQIAGSFETSKADIDVEAPADGFIFYAGVKPGAIIKVGEVFAVICNDNKYPQIYFDTLPATQKKAEEKRIAENSSANGIRTSKSAQELIDKYKIDVTVFAGKKLVTSEDVEAFINKKTAPAIDAAFVYDRPKVVIIGAGGHAKICIDIIRQNGLYEIVGATSNDKEMKEVMGVAILGTDEEVLEKLFAEGVRFAVIGIGALKKLSYRQEIFIKLKKIGFQMPALIHPRAICEPSAALGEGCQVMAGAVIGSDVRVHHNCIINAGSIISHDCYLEENVHITPGGILAGNVYIGKNSIIGMGASIYLGVIIGSDVIVSNNANVLKDIPNNTMVAGNPAKTV